MRTLILASSCIEWQRYRNNGGYGLCWCPRLKRTRGAHVIAWERVNGPVPAGFYICHHCDNRACVNVEHLFLGSPSDNQRDMHRKGRARPPRGMRQTNRKLSWTQVQEIRARYAAGEKQQVLADEYGVVNSSVSRAVKGVHWSSES